MLDEPSETHETESTSDTKLTQKALRSNAICIPLYLVSGYSLGFFGELVGGRKEGGVYVHVAAVAYLLEMMLRINFNKLTMEQNMNNKLEIPPGIIYLVVNSIMWLPTLNLRTILPQ